MKQCNNLRRMLVATAVVICAAGALLPGCTKVDDTLGGNLVPDNQQMKVGFVSLSGQLLDGTLNPKKYVESRLFRTDSIISSNISYGYFGSETNDTVGFREAGFLSQYISYYKVDSGYFGYKPIFDSAQLLLSVSTYGHDTLTAQTFAVYEVTSNKYLNEKPIASGKTKRDSTFYINFRPENENMLGNKLFTFILGGDTKPSVTAVTLTPTEAGRSFIKRLMLQEGDYKGNYSIYSTDSLKYWVEAFKGLYICPETPITTANKGTIFATSLDKTGLSIYGRNHVKNDPTLIKDTIGMVYYFYNSGSSYGNVSVNSIRHDYTKSKFNLNESDFIETNENRPANSRLFVEGMGGVVSELTVTPDFFKEMESLITAENAKSGKNFNSFAFSQVRMSIYFPGSNYDWQAITDVNRLADAISNAPSRLGMYTDYKALTGITDYAYAYEKSYSSSLTYSGYINRSRGCYVMDITGHMQKLWKSYRTELNRVGGDFSKIDWSKVSYRKIYLGPEAYSLYTPTIGYLQGETTTSGETPDNNAPIRLDLTYNMIK